MSLSLGLVGLPNVGKSTLFNALTKSNVLAANYPFATIEPNTGIVSVPDERLEVLAKLFASKAVVPSTVTFIDIAGLVKGAAQGEGMGNSFLSNVRHVDAICHLVRGFSATDVIHVSNQINPKQDIEIIETELILADLQTLSKVLVRLEKEAKKSSLAKTLWQEALVIQEILNKGEILSNHPKAKNFSVIKELNLLTAKPFVYVFNVDEIVLSDKFVQKQFKELVAPAPAVFLNAKIELELSNLSLSEAKELLAVMGQSELGLSQLVKVGFEVLGLQTFLTAGEKEVRAWTIPKGATAAQAAGKIHSDFERGFIKAQIVSYSDLITYGSVSGVKAEGKLRLEGRDYIMKDDDIVEFKFNV